MNKQSSRKVETAIKTMGKSRRNKRSHRPDPTSVSNTIAIGTACQASEDGEMQMEAELTPSSVTSVIESIQHSNPDERECGCAMLSNLVNQGGTIRELLSAKIVKIVGPLMTDENFSTRQHAVGALRNMSVEGDCDVCLEMVRQDIMTPLAALILKHGACPQLGEDKKVDELRNGVFLQAVHLLWNLCENSEVAVGVATKQGLVQILLARLICESSSLETKVSIAQCLYTITDSNADLSLLISGQELSSQLEMLIGSLHTNNEQLLLRVLCIGILYNVNTGSLITGSGEILGAIIQVLSLALEQDSLALIKKVISLFSAEESPVGSGEISDEYTPDISDPSLTKNDLLDAEISNLKHMLAAQSVAVELVANLCCPDDESEDWEDLEDSGDDNSSMEGAVDEAAAAGDLPPLCVPTEIHSLFVSQQIVPKVLSKSYPLDGSVLDGLNRHKKTKALLASIRNLQSRSLLCVSNMVNAMETSSLGGLEQLREIWTVLSKLSTTQSVLQEESYLDAVTSAMRASAQKLIDAGSPMFASVTAEDLQFLFEMGLKCKNANVRTNAIRIVSGIGCSLAKDLQPHPLLKDIGMFLIESCCNEKALWVVAEGLDAIFDVFAEDHLDPLVKDILLVERLKTLAPSLKNRIKSERKTLGEHLPIISTARTNLVRFIKYKHTH